jgi:hypothetical protein
MQKASVTSDGKLKVDAVLEAENITIGNVKIQDASTSNLAAVNSDGQLAVQNPPNLDAKASDIKSDLDTISGQLDAKTSTLAKESGGNLAALAGKDFATQTTLAAIKAKTDNLDAASSTLAKESGGNLATIAGQLDVKASTLAKESGGNLAAAKADLDTISGQLDAKTSTLARESGGNLATIAGQLDSKISTLAKESGGNLAAIRGQTDKLTFDAGGNLRTSSRIESVVDNGNGFVSSTGPNTVGNGDVRFALFIAGTGKVTRITKLILSLDSVRRWRILVGPTITSNGTLQGAQNRRLNNAQTAVSQLYTFPTLTADGSLLYDFWGSAGATLPLDTTLTLDPNQALNFITSGGPGQNASIAIEWDEQPI